MTKVEFYKPEEIADSLVKFVVMAVRYENRWVFSRHRERTTWDMPGGHREAGESVEQAARRELWEESGAAEAEIVPVSVYSVTKNGETDYGMLFYAQIKAMGELPEAFEMEEVLVTDKLPQALTYPDILPDLFWKIQGWMNLQSGAGELWDVYDSERRVTGKLHRRGEPLKEGEYHLVVHVWMLNSCGQFLITKRAPNKGFPNIWESTGGSALAGDDSLSTALREVKEETGLSLDPDRGACVLSVRKDDYFRDVWLFRQDFDLRDVVLQSGETVDKMYADQDLIRRLWDAGEFVPYDYLPQLFMAAKNGIDKHAARSIIKEERV